MPRELIFTSVPSGLKPGSSGYCTVARHEDMDPMLERELERLSFYEMDGGLHPIIHAFRILRLQSGNHYVLSRICYSGSDHTGRTNYIAHHLVFDEAETYALGGTSPADYFLDTIGWMDEWPKGKQPVLFGPGEGEKAPYPASPPPASNSTWARITGDPLNAHEPLYRHSWRFITPDGGHAEPLSLISEFCSQPEANVQWAWGTYTFTTFLQTSDQSVDFRCVAGPASGAVASVAHDTLHLGNPVASCFQAAGAGAPGALSPQQVPVVEKAPAEQAPSAQSQDADRQALEQSFVDEGEPITESAPASEEPAYETVENDLMSRYAQPKRDDVPDPTQADVRRATRTPFSGKPGSGTRPDLLAGKRSNLNVGLEEKSKSSKKFLIFSLTFVFLSILGAGGYLFRGPIMKAFESTDDEEIAKGDEKGDDGKESKDPGSDKKDGAKKADSPDQIKRQQELATNAVADAKTAFEAAKTAKGKADEAIKEYNPNLKEVEPYKGWLSDATNAVTAAETAFDAAKAAKNAADNAKDLKSATTAATEARSQATEAENQKDMAENAKTKVEGAIKTAKEKKATATAAQANADVTLVPFKGDEKVPVTIVFVDQPDVVSGTNVFAWSKDGKKSEWMESGEESKILATRKEEKKKGEDFGAKLVLVSATYEIKKTGTPVKIKAGSFSELRFKEGRKLHSKKFEAYKKNALEFKTHFTTSDFPKTLPVKTPKVKQEIQTSFTDLLIESISEQEITRYPKHLETIIGRELTEPAKKEFNTSIGDPAEDVKEYMGVKKYISEKFGEGIKKNKEIQQAARDKIAKRLKKPKAKIKWSGSVTDITYLLKDHLSTEAKKRGIVDSSISIPGSSIKDIKAINVRTLKADKRTSKERQDFDEKWRKQNKNQPPTSKEENDHFKQKEKKMLSEFEKYANAEIAKFKKDGLEKAFAKDIEFNPQEKTRWITILKKLEEGDRKLKALEEDLFDPKNETWQLKEDETVLLKITPN